MKNQTIIRLNAGNCVNGNPRRVFVYIVDGVVRGAYDEGYSGQQAMPENLRGLYKGTTFLTSPAQYRAMLRDHPI